MRGREFGTGIRAALSKTGLSGRALAEKAGWDTQKLSDMLNGKGGVTEADLHRLFGLCQTPLEEANHLVALYRETNQSGWLQVHGDQFPITLRTLSDHEAVATEIIFWSFNHVPGVLQLPDYLRALIDGDPNVPNKESDARVAARVALQQQLFGPPLQADLLHRRTGSAPPRRQCRTDVGSAGPHQHYGHPPLHHQPRRALLHRSPRRPGWVLSILKFAKLEPIVFIEAENHGVFLDDKESIKVYGTIAAALDRIALDEAQSKELIARTAS